MRPVDADTLLITQYELFEKLAAQRQISLAVSLPEDAPLPRIYGDEQRLCQVLSILIDNALSYTPAGGRVVLGAKGEGGNVLLSVSDDGPGIPDAEKQRIFERFYRADGSRSKKDHHGLGLSIAREIVSLHHGRLEVRDAPGGCGSVFTATFPACRPEVRRRRDPEAE